MRTFFPTLITISSFIGLVGCGTGGQSNASLQVSKAFAMTNPNFGGGLIISGKNLSTGKSFSKGLTTTMSMDIVLERGTWLITAVGWDGGASSATPFGGRPYCGKIQKDLLNADETVDLNVSQAECATPFFAGAHADTVSTPNTVKHLGLINTCETFFKSIQSPTEQISGRIVEGGSSTDTFCEMLGSDMQTDVGAVKIYAMNKDLNAGTPLMGFSSPCIKASSSVKSKIEPGSVSVPSNPYQSGSELRLPVGGIPFAIVTFKDDTCSRPIATFPFKNGLGAGDPANFDHLLYAHNSTDIKLILPSSDMKRAYSPFQAILPFFKRYNSGAPEKFLTAPSSLGSYQYHGVVNQINNVVVDNQNTCTTVSTGGYVTSATCLDLGDKVQISFSGSTEGPGSFMMNAQTYNVYLDNTSFGINRFDSQKLAMELMGHDSGYDMNRFFGINDRDENDYGALSAVRNILSANGAGGVLGITDKNNSFADECNNRIEDRTISIFDEEKFKFESYRVVLHNNPVSTPSKFICNNLNMDEADCATNGQNFTKRMIIYDHQQSTIQPAMVLEFNCDEMIGRFEMNQIEIEGLKKDEVKQVINWNTNSESNLGYQRFERVRYTKIYDYNGSSWIQKDEDRQTARVVKNGGDDYEAWTFTYHTHKNLSNTFDQMISYRRLKTGSTTTLNFASDGAAVTNANPTFILADAAYNSLLDKTPNNSEIGISYFSPSSAFPQVQGGTVASFYDLATSFTNTNQMNGNLNFTLRTLGQPAFINTFGTSFYTSP